MRAFYAAFDISPYACVLPVVPVFAQAASTSAAVAAIRNFFMVFPFKNGFRLPETSGVGNRRVVYTTG